MTAQTQAVGSAASASDSDLYRVVHVITGTDVGGAERVLQSVVQASENRFSRNQVISLAAIGPIGERLIEAGIPVHTVDMKRGLPGPLSLMRLRRLLRRSDAEVIQTWMYHADLLAGLFAGGRPVVWNIHNGNLDAAATRRRTRWVARLCARFSARIPARILCCSAAAREVHVAFGYDAARIQLQPNGFDLAQFSPDPDARRALRAEIGVDEDTPLYGLVARYDPAKDIPNFLAAAAQVHAQLPQARFVLVGQGLEPSHAGFRAMVDAIAGQVPLLALGRRADVARVYAALDVLVLSSLGEALPNVLGEAMASEVPCVTTDSGDCALMVGDTGMVVPVGDARALATAMLAMWQEGPAARRRRGAAARLRVQQEFDIQAVAASYARVHREVIQEAR